VKKALRAFLLIAATVFSFFLAFAWIFYQQWVHGNWPF